MAIGISRVPDGRLDQLTAMYKPRSHVPATIEFTDVVVAGRAEAQTLVDVVGHKNADAPVHVVRAFRDPAVPHPEGEIDPVRAAQAMEDELILADLGVIERREDRIAKYQKRAKTSELEKELDLVHRCRAALELTPEDVKRLSGFHLLSAKPWLLVIHIDESDVADVATGLAQMAERTGLAPNSPPARFTATSHAASSERRWSRTTPSSPAAPWLPAVSMARFDSKARSSAFGTATSSTSNSRPDARCDRRPPPQRSFGG